MSVRNTCFLQTKYSGFTLVELIVVITILAILGTIGFVQLWGFAGSARDSVRISNLNALKKGLDLSQIQTGVYPLPESSVNITASGTIIGYQGFAKEQVESVAKLSPGATKDPSDTTMYTTYSTNQNQTKMQAMVFLEDGGSVSVFLPSLERGIGGIFPTANASSTSDYSKRFPSTTGDSLGILLSNSGTDTGKPAQEISSIVNSGSLDIQRTSDMFKAYFSASDTLEGTGTELQSLQISYLHGAGLNSPSKCPTGFIPVPGNKEFSQPGFCVAKYEMKPVSTVGLTQHATYKTWNYATWMTIISTSVGEPIASINQWDAIQLCKNLGTGYHLITNNEWMTIARNVEANSVNWSTNTIGSGYIYSWHSDTIPTNALSASSNDSDGYNQTNNISGNQKRTLTLSNNQVVWDLAGNIREHVNKANTMDGSNYGTGWTNLDPTSTTWHVTGWNASVFDLSRKLYGPSSSTYTHTIHGIGNIYGIGPTTLITGNIFIRGGNWSYLNTAGLFSLDLDWQFDFAGGGLGFRCAR